MECIEAARTNDLQRGGCRVTPQIGLRFADSGNRIVQAVVGPDRSSAFRICICTPHVEELRFLIQHISVSRCNPVHRKATYQYQNQALRRRSNHGFDVLGVIASLAGPGYQ